MVIVQIHRRDAPAESGKGVLKFTVPNEEKEKIRGQLMPTKLAPFVVFKDADLKEHFIAADIIRSVSLQDIR